ncbi:retrotransposon protein, putative, ty1-copia subclass, partial [Tanacetum coccineum]
MSAPVKSSTIAFAISCKLTRTNFLLWKAQVIPILRGVQLFGHLDGSMPAPPTTAVTGPSAAGKETTEPVKESPNPEYQTWVIQDRNRRPLLSTIRKGDMTAAKYYQKMTGFADTMANIGQPMNDEEVIGYMLAGLGPGHAAAIGNTVEFTSSANNASRQESNSNTPHRNYSNTNDYNNSNQRGNYRGGGGRRRGCGRGRNSGGPRCQDYRGGNSVLTGSYNPDTNWYLDTGATDHLTSDLDCLTVQERYHGKDQVQVENGAGLSISHIGHSIIPGLSRPLALKNVLYVPHINQHLLSAQRLVFDNHVFIELYPNVFFVKDIATKKTLLLGRSKRGLYPIPISHSRRFLQHTGLSSVNVSSSQWHQHFGHPTSTVVKTILDSNKLGCSFHNESVACDACQRAKSHQLPYNNSVRVTTFPLELVHTDVWGPTQVSIRGFKYYVSFLDDYSRYTWIYLIKHKSDV